MRIYFSKSMLMNFNSGDEHLITSIVKDLPALRIQLQNYKDINFKQLKSKWSDDLLDNFSQLYNLKYSKRINPFYLQNPNFKKLHFITAIWSEFDRAFSIYLGKYKLQLINYFALTNYFLRKNLECLIKLENKMKNFINYTDRNMREASSDIFQIKQWLNDNQKEYLEVQAIFPQFCDEKHMFQFFYSQIVPEK